MEYSKHINLLPKEGGFKRLFCINLKKVQNWLMGVLGLIVSLILSVYPGDLPVVPRIAYAALILLFSFMLMIIITLYQTAAGAYNVIELPRIAEVKRRERLCLIYPSELFSYDGMVSFYHVGDGGFEQLVAVGHVVNIQDNRFIQVRFTKFIEGYDDLTERLLANDELVIQRIKVKPNVPRSYLDDYFRKE